MKLDVLYPKSCQKMTELPDESIPLMATDPPYAIGFMNKEWDKFDRGKQTRSQVVSWMRTTMKKDTRGMVEFFTPIWKEALRVLKPGAFAFVMCIPRQDCLSRMIVSLEDAGFDVGFTPMFHAFASGFPKAQNIAKNISKAIDKLKRKMYNSSIWKKNLNNVKSAEKLFLNDLIEVGLLTTSSGFVLEDVQKFYITKKLTVSVKIAEINSSEVPHILDKNTFIVPQNVATLPKQKLSSVQIVELKLDDQSQEMSIKIIFVPVDVQTFICEKVESKIKEDVVQRTGDGKRKSWNETDIDVLCAEVIEGLRLITLSRLKNILNFDTNYQTELPTATNVIITKSIRECLTISTADIVGQRIRGDVEKAKQSGTTFAVADANKNNKAIFGYGIEDLTIPSTPVAKSLNGSYAGMQVKPAVEVVIVAMKPLSEKTYVDQALKNGKGISWLDSARIPYNSNYDEKHQRDIQEGQINAERGKFFGGKGQSLSSGNLQGRFPGNLLVSDDALNDGKSGHSVGHYSYQLKKPPYEGGWKSLKDKGNLRENNNSFSRYFSLDVWFDKKLKELPKNIQKTFPFLIVPKANKSEKNRGCEKLFWEKDDSSFGYHQVSSPRWIELGEQEERIYKETGERVSLRAKGNIHPTVKPLKLFCYLITLGSREGDIVLDPFFGSGTTGVAARMLGRHYIGWETGPENVKIAKARLSTVESMLL